MSDVVTCAACGTRNRVPAASTGRPRCARCHADLPWVVDADAGGFDAATSTGAGTLVLVDLWAPWCGPCRVVSPLVERLAAELAGRLKVVKVDVDRAPSISERFLVQGIPTLLLLREGRVVARQVGALGDAALRAWVAPHLPAPD